MRINRKFLYTGAFLVALGAVLVVADLGTLDLTIVRDALRLWPVAIVVIGLAIVVRRSPVALPLGLLAAAIPGLALGGAIAVGPRFVAECASPVAETPASVTEGEFIAGGARDVAIHARCGSFQVRTEPGRTGWTLDIGGGSAPAPTIDAGGSLAIDAAGSTTGLGWGEWTGLIGRASAWDLALPTGDLGAMSTTFEATQSTIDLANTRLRSFAVTSTASQVAVDLSSTFVSDISTVTSIGQLTLVLPESSDPTVNVGLSGGDVRICTGAVLNGPVGLRVTGRLFAGHVAIRGQTETGGSIDYQSQGYELASHHADIRITGSFGSIEIDNGGCSK